MLKGSKDAPAESDADAMQINEVTTSPHISAYVIGIDGAHFAHTSPVTSPAPIVDPSAHIKAIDSGEAAFEPMSDANKTNNKSVMTLVIRAIKRNFQLSFVSILYTSVVLLTNYYSPSSSVIHRITKKFRQKAVLCSDRANKNPSHRDISFLFGCDNSLLHGVSREEVITFYL